MQLPQPLGQQRNKRGRNRRRDREVRRVDLIQRAAAAGHFFPGVLQRVVHVRAVPHELSGSPADYGRVADGAVADVGVRFGHVVEGGFGDAEVFGEDRFRGFGDPVVDVEGGSVLI